MHGLDVNSVMVRGTDYTRNWKYVDLNGKVAVRGDGDEVVGSDVTGLGHITKFCVLQNFTLGTRWQVSKDGEGNGMETSTFLPLRLPLQIIAFREVYDTSSICSRNLPSIRFCRHDLSLRKQVRHFRLIYNGTRKPLPSNPPHYLRTHPKHPMPISPRR